MKRYKTSIHIISLPHVLSIHVHRTPKNVLYRFSLRLSLFYSSMLTPNGFLLCPMQPQNACLFLLRVFTRHFPELILDDTNLVVKIFQSSLQSNHPGLCLGGCQLLLELLVSPSISNIKLIPPNTQELLHEFLFEPHVALPALKCLSRLPHYYRKHQTDLGVRTHPISAVPSPLTPKRVK